MTPGIQTIVELNADLPLENSIVLSPIPGFQFPIGPNKGIKWELRGIFTLGPTGGFRFRAAATNTVGLNAYNAEWIVVANGATASFASADLTPTDFTDPAAVAKEYITLNRGEVTAGPLGSQFSIQFAQNNATLDAIILRSGLTLSIWQF